MTDDHPGRWRALLVLSVSQLLGMCTWFAGNAVAGWQWAFPVLAVGPAAGIAAIARLGLQPRQ